MVKHQVVQQEASMCALASLTAAVIKKIFAFNTQVNTSPASANPAESPYSSCCQAAAPHIPTSYDFC